MTEKDFQLSRKVDEDVEYELIWRKKFLTTHVTTFDEMIDALQEAVNELRAMRAAGVVLADTGTIQDDYAYLVTTDPAIAAEFGFERAECFEDDEDEDEDEDFEGDEFEDDGDEVEGGDLSI